MGKSEARACWVRLVICICAVAAAAAVERYVPAVRTGDITAVFASVGRATVKKQSGNDVFGEVCEVLSVPNVTQTIDSNATESAVCAPAITIAYAED